MGQRAAKSMIVFTEWLAISVCSCSRAVEQLQSWRAQIRREEFGSKRRGPLGVARRVILRELEIGLNLEAGKLIHQGQCGTIN